MLTIKRARESESSVSDVVTLERGPSTPLLVGEQLRLTREKLDLQIEDVADSLKIRRQHLNAIEDGRIEDLPGHAYAIGFVRAYADYLGLDKSAIVERFKDETSALDEQSRLVFPSPMPEGRTPGGALILIAVVGVALVYGAWIYVSAQDRSLAEIVPALPESLQALISSEDTAPSKPAAPTAPAPTASTPIEAAQNSQRTPLNDENGLAAASAPAQGEKLSDSAATLAISTASQSTNPPQSNELSKSATPDDASVASAIVPSSSSGKDARTPISENNAAPKAQGVVKTTPVAPRLEKTVRSLEKKAPGETATGNATAVLSGEAVTPSTPARRTSEALEGKSKTSKDVASILDTIEIPNNIPGSIATPGTDETLATLPPTPPSDEQTGPRKFGVENKNSRITIVAIVDSWVEIRDGDGALLLTRLLKAGDSYLAPNRPGLKMHTGNAGGLRLEIDGKTAPPLGPKGAVRRNISLDPETLKSGGASE